MLINFYFNYNHIIIATITPLTPQSAASNLMCQATTTQAGLESTLKFPTLSVFKKFIHFLPHGPVQPNFQDHILSWCFPAPQLALGKERRWKQEQDCCSYGQFSWLFQYFSCCFEENTKSWVCRTVLTYCMPSHMLRRLLVSVPLPQVTSSIKLY